MPFVYDNGHPIIYADRAVWGRIDELVAAANSAERYREALLAIATDSDLVYMGCSDIPHCGGRTMGDPIHQPDCVVGVAQRALGINNAGEPWVTALSEQEGQ